MNRSCKPLLGRWVPRLERLQNSLGCACRAAPAEGDGLPLSLRAQLLAEARHCPGHPVHSRTSGAATSDDAGSVHDVIPAARRNRSSFPLKHSKRLLPGASRCSTARTIVVRYRRHRPRSLARGPFSRRHVLRASFAPPVAILLDLRVRRRRPALGRLPRPARPEQSPGRAFPRCHVKIVRESTRSGSKAIRRAGRLESRDHVH